MSDGFEIIESFNEIAASDFEVQDAGLEWEADGTAWDHGLHFNAGEVVHANGYINGHHVWVEMDNRDHTAKVAIGDSPSYPDRKMSMDGALHYIRQHTK